jgi:hypothetical protein
MLVRPNCVLNGLYEGAGNSNLDALYLSRARFAPLEWGLVWSLTPLLNWGFLVSREAVIYFYIMLIALNFVASNAAFATIIFFLRNRCQNGILIRQIR